MTAEMYFAALAIYLGKENRRRFLRVMFLLQSKQLTFAHIGQIRWDSDFVFKLRLVAPWRLTMDSC